MMRTAIALAAGVWLLLPARSLAAQDGDPARDAALEALASKADMPAARPALPSLLAERDAALRVRGANEGRSEAADVAGQGTGAARSEAERAAAKAARMEAKLAAQAARSEAKLAAQAARAEAKAAREEARRAAEKAREEKTRKKPKPAKPPRPPGGGASP